MGVIILRRRDLLCRRWTCSRMSRFVGLVWIFLFFVWVRMGLLLKIWRFLFSFVGCCCRRCCLLRRRTRLCPITIVWFLFWVRVNLTWLFLFLFRKCSFSFRSFGRGSRSDRWKWDFVIARKVGDVFRVIEVFSSRTCRFRWRRLGWRIASLLRG